MANYSCALSAFIATLEEARDYYQRKLGRAHAINCHGKRVTIVFEPAGTHLYSVDAKGAPIPPDLLVSRWLSPTRTDKRKFDLPRAQLMDEVLKAVEHYTVSVPGTGAYAGANRMLHGLPLPGGRHMRVVLRPGPGTAFTCVSAYTVDAGTHAAMRRAKRARFP